MSATETTTKNRRRQRRQKSKRITRITCTRGTLQLERNVAQRLLDLSSSGAALVVTEAFEAGEDVVLGLDLPWRSRPLSLSAHVVWCVPTSRSQYCIGVKLTRPLDYRDLMDFVNG
jgi:hypothetical protein